MSKPSIKLEEIEKILFQDDEFKREYNALKPEYEKIESKIQQKIKRSKNG